jgi:uncharacterized protein DUF6152
MRVRLSVLIAALGLVLAAAPAPAHHAFGSEFNVDKPVALRGTVTMMEWVNPHSWIHLDVKGPDGAVVEWMVEGGSPNALLRLGFTKNALLPGMEIVVEGYQAKDASNKAVGKSLMFADGRKLFLGMTEPGAKGP